MADLHEIDELNFFYNFSFLSFERSYFFVLQSDGKCLLSCCAPQFSNIVVYHNFPMECIIINKKHIFKNIKEEEISDNNRWKTMALKNSGYSHRHHLMIFIFCIFNFYIFSLSLSVWCEMLTWQTCPKRHWNEWSSLLFSITPSCLYIYIYIEKNAVNPVITIQKKGLPLTFKSKHLL